MRPTIQVFATGNLPDGSQTATPKAKLVTPPALEQCWGSNASGVYGSGDTSTQPTTPANVSNAATWSRYFVSVAGSHYAALRAGDASLHLW